MSKRIRPPAPERPSPGSPLDLASHHRHILVRSCARPLLTLFLFLLAPIPANAQEIDHPASGLPIPRSRLTPEEVELASRIAMSGSVASRAGKTVLSRVKMAVGDKDEPQSLLAVVTTYNYERHETSRRLIDLTRESIVWERIVSDGSAPLAQVEVEEARRLVLQDARIQGLVGSSLDGVELEFPHPIITDARHRLFGKRVVLVLFKTEDGYRSDLPAVFANLTDAEVLLEE